MFSSLHIFLLYSVSSSSVRPSLAPRPQLHFSFASTADVSSLKRPFLTRCLHLCNMCTVSAAAAVSAFFPCPAKWPPLWSMTLLRILIHALITLSLAMCMNVCRGHPKPSLLRAEVVLSLSVTQTATWKMHVPSHFSRAWPCDPMNCSLPGCSVHGIFQAEILEWVALPSFRGSSRPRDRTCISYVSCIEAVTLECTNKYFLALRNVRGCLT